MQKVGDNYEVIGSVACGQVNPALSPSHFDGLVVQDKLAGKGFERGGSQARLSHIPRSVRLPLEFQPKP